MMEDHAEIELGALKLKRGQLKAQITRFKTFLASFSADSDIIELETRLISVESSTLERFNDIQNAIESLQQNLIQDEERDIFENSYFKAIAEAKRIIANRNKTISVSNSNNASDRDSIGTSTVNDTDIRSRVKLPQLNLPEFQGQYDQWLAFYDTFNSLIDRNTYLSDIEKFYYLKACIKGEAAHVIESIEVSSINYKIAFQMLKERYENKKLIVHTHVKAIFELNSLKNESHPHLRKLLDNFNKNLRALNALGQPTETWDTLLIYILSSKLDLVTKREYEESVGKVDDPKITNLTDFIADRCQLLETIENKNKTKTISTDKHFTHLAAPNITCSFCSKPHFNFKCEAFLKMPIKERISEIKRRRLCMNCLRPGHIQKNCKSGSCKQCGRKHNSLVHTTENETYNADQSSSHANSQLATVSSEAITVTAMTEQPTQVLLATAVVYLKNRAGKPIPCRALLDSGSTVNLITKSLATKLKLDATNIDVPIAGVNNTKTTVTVVTETTLTSQDGGYKYSGKFLIINQITRDMPQLSFDPKLINIPHNIQLADVAFNQSRPVDVLLGAQVFFEILTSGTVNLGRNNPVLQNTKLGWVVSGQIQLDAVLNDVCHLTISNETLRDQLQQFWQIEETNTHGSLTSQESECEQHFVKTCARNANGRYVVSLPFKDNHVELGNSADTAIKRFKNLEHRLQKTPTLKVEYIKFIREYKALGHMTETNISDESNRLYYLPHHCVIKEDSATTKLRVVFDASCKTSTGISLNDVLKIGPVIQRDLFGIVLSFRKHNIVLTADIEKMYRQIEVVDADRDYQRIVWREQPEDELKYYRLNTVTYGTAPASFLAVRALHQAAVDNATDSRVVNIIKSDFYMDDLITGTDTLEDALYLKEQISNALQAACLPLRKWRSNKRGILGHYNVDDGDEYILSDKQSRKTLGLFWNSEADTLHYSVHLDIGQANSKRIILSTISKIFDPLGLISPVTVRAKLFIQYLWQARLDWDEELPDPILKSWTQFHTQLSALNNLEIPRQVTIQGYEDVQIHGFCDASERAYGACVYIRCIDTNGKYHCNLLCAKSRVAPLKKVSLPRLELCGAVLLTQLVKKIQQNIAITFRKRTFWCDSMIALAWISAESTNWKTFVANRVAEVHEASLSNEWRHVSSGLNPADIVSRGATPEDLARTTLWWRGPEFLSLGEEFWPQPKPISNAPATETERKKPVSIMFTTVNELGNLFERFSCLSTLIRVVALMLRFTYNARPKNTVRLNGELTRVELERATTVLVKMVQNGFFALEISALTLHKQLPKSSKILSLDPFVDKEGLLRVGGRLEHSQEPYDSRHPLLLPSSHRFTHQVIHYEHIRNMHAGTQTVLAAVRRKFWPINGKNTVKKVLRKCIKCFKVNPNNNLPKMGNLPKARVTPARPFLSVGVDFAGPIEIKAGMTRTNKLIKAYICIFICFVTKAIHLELVVGLTTESFINSLRRFVARRGLCNKIYSDNATNFVGASNELKRFYNWVRESIKESDVREFLLSRTIEWSFIPPRSPHFGGIWEANIKSVKTHLSKVVGNTHLTYEQLHSVLCQIECVLNSRPLTPLSTDPNDLSALTPGHFLIGDNMMSLPARDGEGGPVQRLKLYERMQTIVQHFWKRWSAEYLHTLQQRTKWKANNPHPIQKDALVLLKQDGLPTSQWKLGRIVDTHPGEDGIVRVVTVKTTSGVFRRSVTRVCVLPVER